MKRLFYVINLFVLFSFFIYGCSDFANVQDNSKTRYVQVTFDYQSPNLQNFTKYVKAGSPIMEPNKPYNEGYTFKGWYNNSQLGIKWNFNEPVYSDTTLYAQWEPNNSSKINVSFDANGGFLTDSSVAEITSENKIPVPSEPEYEGYEFSGWSDTPNGNTLWNFEDNVTSNLTLYAKWKKIVE